MKTRYSFGGDEHIFVEVDEEMSLEAFFKSLVHDQRCRRKQIKGLLRSVRPTRLFRSSSTRIMISPDDMLAELKKIEDSAEHAEQRIETRIVEVPVYYQDPGPTRR